MKSYKEFCKLAERYYEPHEPLPSGKTPKGKATSSYYRQSGEYFRNPRVGKGGRTYNRMVNQRNRTWNQVSRGADNPDLNFRPDRSGKYDVSGDSKNITINNRDGIRMNVRQKPNVYYDSSKTTRTGRIPRPVYDIEWYNNKNTGRNNPGQARSVVRSVADMWKTQVEPRLPRNSVITNFPVSNDTSDRNTRSKLYSKVANFGPQIDSGRQYAKVGSNPSPKQSAKGASKVKPLTPGFGNQVGDVSPFMSQNELDKFNKARQRKFTPYGNSTATQGAPRKIAPAKPSRPSVTREIKNLANKPSVKAPSVPKTKIKPRSRRGGGGMFGSFPTIGTPSNRGSFPTTLGGVFRQTSGPISPGDMMRRGGV